VREWLKEELSAEDRKVIGEDIKYVQTQWPVGKPTCGAMGGGLWEVRSDLHDGRIARVLFCFHDDTIVLLHGFEKKTQKTPSKDLQIARDRMAQVKAAVTKGTKRGGKKS
jgi:phage-related protein